MWPCESWGERTFASRDYTLLLRSTYRLIVRGAREHNLKNLTIELPCDELIVLPRSLVRSSRRLPSTL